MRFRIFLVICLICGSTNTRAVPSEIISTVTRQVRQLRRLFSSEDISEIGVVQNQLALMRALDQKARESLSSGDETAIKLLAVVDQFNTGQIKKILSRHRWVCISKFGVSADTNAWLLVQHADHDLKFQKTCLRTLEGLLKVKETNPQNYAYLYDRVAVGESRPQRYGTQAKIEGKVELYPFEGTAEALEARRKELGLNSLKDYLEEIRKLYTPSV